MKTTKTRNYLRWVAALALCAVSLAQGGDGERLGAEGRR